jgi:hypothetical protein
MITYEKLSGTELVGYFNQLQTTRSLVVQSSLLLLLPPFDAFVVEMLCFLAVREAHKTKSTSAILGLWIEATKSCISPQGLISGCVTFTVYTFQSSLAEFCLIGGPIFYFLLKF